MQPDYDADYYERRERVAYELAAQAIDPAVQRIHRQMAERYGELKLQARRILQGAAAGQRIA